MKLGSGRTWQRLVCRRRGHGAWRLVKNTQAGTTVQITWRCGRCGHEDHYEGRLL